MSKQRRLLIILAALLALSLTVGAASAAPAQQCGTNYVVHYGDNLYRISLRFGVSMNAIARANNIWNYNVVYAGQTLYIPCAGGYQPQYVQPQMNPVYPQTYNPNPNRHHLYSGAPPYYANVWVPPVTGYVPQPYYPQQPVSGGTCGGLVPTSPLGGLAHGGNTFYWNSSFGVTNYRVNVYGVDVNPGALVASFTTGGAETFVSGDLGGIPGYQLAWDVQGLVNGAVVCTSPRHTMGHAVK